MPTLAELRARKHKSLPTHAQRITLDQELIADVQRLETEKSDLLVAARRSQPDDEERDAPPRKMGENASPPRVAEIDAELEALYDRIRESEGELLLRGITGGDWLRWKDEHPPREKNAVDAQVAFGLCNASDLLSDLGRYVAAWDGEDLAPGDWDEWLRDSIAPGDLRDLVTAVVNMHERSGVRIPLSSSGSSTTETSATD